MTTGVHAQKIPRLSCSITDSQIAVCMDYLVIITYEIIKSAHRSYHDTLKPGISISSLGDSPSACTLGVLFKTEEEPGKKFILTVKHGVEEEDAPIIQPGALDNGTMAHNCAEVSRYNFCGAYRFPQFENNEDYRNYKGHLLDYAFCEINDRGVEIPSNRPLGAGIVINNIRIVGDVEQFANVRKVGRRSALTHGRISEKYLRIRYRRASDDPIYALKVYDNFGDRGDSGAPVFDEDGMLWGIFHGIKNTRPESPNPEAIIIPIHLILEHARRVFGVDFRLL